MSLSLFKMIKYFLEKKKTIFVVALIILVTILSSAKLFSQLYYLPPNHIFIGVTHFYADFFYYLDQFYQGAHGSWLTYNNFTTENFKNAFLYFNNILLGKIGGLIGLEAFTTYNLSLLFLKFIYLIVCYYFLQVVFPKSFRHRIYAFLMFVFSTSIPLIFFDVNNNIKPIIVFRAQNTFFTRFSNIPSQYIENIIFLFLVLIGYKYLYLIQQHLSLNERKNKFIQSAIKFTSLSVILNILLSISNPVKSGIYITMIFLGVIFIKPRVINKKYIFFTLFPFFVIFIIFLISSLYMKIIIFGNPVYANALKWDYQEYVSQLNLLNIINIFKSFGLLGVFFIWGLIASLFKKTTLIEKMVIVGAIISIVGYFIPYYIDIFNVPGFQFILMSTYLFMAIISMNFLDSIEKDFNKKITFILLLIYLIINLITISNSLVSEIAPLQEPDYHFSYIDSDIYQGLMYLRYLQPSSANVLSDNDKTWDLVIPGITGKKTFTGHFLLNYKSEEKNKFSKSFYYGCMNANTAKSYLIKNNIKYIMVTRYSLTEFNRIFITCYPFVKLLFTNSSISIFSY